MLSDTDTQFACTCSQGLQKLYEFACQWQKNSGHQLPWLSLFCEDIVTLHTRLDYFVKEWDRKPPNDDAFFPSVSGKSGWSGNF